MLCHHIQATAVTISTLLYPTPTCTGTPVVANTEDRIMGSCFNYGNYYIIYIIIPSYYLYITCIYHIYKHI